MARILFVWELGMGFGHLSPYIDVVRTLRRKGHEVIFAARDVENADRVFARDGVTILQAPLSVHRVSNPYRITFNYAQLMHNNGFADLTDLFGRVKAWLHIFRYVKPDVMIFDHSPTGLLASRMVKVKRIIGGSGFLIPPAVTPLPVMRYWGKSDANQIRKAEQRVLATVNKVLQAMKQPPLTNLAEMFQTDGEWLLSFPEMDHYPQRKTGNYVGMFSPSEYGEDPVWPAGKGRKIFCYLYNYKNLPALLKLLNQSGNRALVHGPQIPIEVRKKFSSPRVRFSAKPLNVQRLGQECDLVITNGTFGTTAAFMLAGKPALMIPTNLERMMVARRVVGMGAGLAAAAGKPEMLGPRLRALLKEEKFRKAAQDFAAKHKDESLAGQTEKMVATLENLLPAAPG